MARIREENRKGLRLRSDSRFLGGITKFSGLALWYEVQTECQWETLLRKKKTNDKQIFIYM